MITDKHRAFARAVVALAREHRMTNLRIGFRNSVGQEGGYEEVVLAWSEGRHGEPAEIALETRASEHISEG